MSTVPIFYEWEIPDSHRNTFIVKTQSLFPDLGHKLISNNFSGVNWEFLIRKKTEELAPMLFDLEKISRDKIGQFSVTSFEIAVQIVE